MKRLNLMPSARRESLARRERTRWWGVFLAAWALVCAGSLLLIRAGAPTEAEPARGRLDQLASKIAALEKTDAGLRVTLAEWSRRAEAGRAVGHWPDWSRLLRLLADRRGNDVALSSITLEPPASGAARRGDAATPAGFSLVVEGVARGQAAATSYVLRLEQSEVFDRMTLAETRSRDFRGEPAVGFRLEAELGRPGKQEKPDAR
jgi:Tfp pilus assembly protein PilN